MESTLYRLEKGGKRKITVESEEFKVRNAINIQSVVEEGIENRLLTGCVYCVDNISKLK